MIGGNDLPVALAAIDDKREGRDRLRDDLDAGENRGQVLGEMRTDRHAGLREASTPRIRSHELLRRSAC